MIKVAIAGLGRMGKLHFLNALHYDGAEVVAVADAQKSNQKSAEKYHITAYDDYKKMIDSEELDAIIISLPNFLKKESVTYASEKGIAIFIDKPLARNLTEAEEIAKVVGARKIPFSVGINYRFFNSVNRVKSNIDDGMLGEILLSTSELILDGPFSHPLVPKQVPDWWFSKEKAGGGALLDLGYHLIDISQWMFGPLDVEYSVLGNKFNLPIEDSATVVMKSRAGPRCILNAGWYLKTVFPEFNFRVNVHGTCGYSSTEHFSPKNLYLHASKEGIKNFLRRISGGKISYLTYTYYYASFTKILHDFLQSVEKGNETPAPVDEQVSVMRVIDQAYKLAK